MEHSVKQLALDFHHKKRIQVIADAPTISSDGGLVLLKQADTSLGLCKMIASHMNESREAYKIQHNKLEQVQQRVFQIACGYDDANDATTLRKDPLFKLACDQEPYGPQELSSQAALSRFENAVSGADIVAITKAFEQAYVKSLSKDTTHITLDIDSSDDKVHGHQQLSLFHGYYKHRMLHPLFVFDGDTGQLVSCVLRPGNSHSAKGASIQLRRIIIALKQRFPGVIITVRGDAGFGIPRLMDMLERLDDEYDDINYIFGIIRNQVLEKHARRTFTRCSREYECSNGTKSVRKYGQFRYAAESWAHDRHVVVRVEQNWIGVSQRYIVSNLAYLENKELYELYCQRGNCENMIKEFKRGVSGDRLSCSRFVANVLRLFLHATAYRLLHYIKVCDEKANLFDCTRQFATLRLMFIKVGAWVKSSVRRIVIRLPKSYPYYDQFIRLSNALGIP